MKQISFEAAKMAYSEELEELASLVFPKATFSDISPHIPDLTDETISNYFKGKTAPASAEKHIAFVEAIVKALIDLKYDQHSKVPALKKRLQAAYDEVEKWRRHKPPTQHIPPTIGMLPNNEQIHRVLSACLTIIEAFIDSADNYALDAIAYFTDVGVLDSPWDGPFTYWEAYNHRRPLQLDAPEEEKALEKKLIERDFKAMKSIEPPPKRKNARKYQLEPDAFDGVEKVMIEYAEEFSATPKMRESLLAVLSACRSLELDLKTYWDLNCPCAESPYLYDRADEVAHRVAIAEEFTSTGRLMDLTNNKAYKARLHEFAQRAEVKAQLVRRLALAAVGELRREVTRRGLESPTRDRARPT